MSSSGLDASQDDSRLNEILARYLQAAESGESIDRDQFIREHVEYANELREFFADKSQIDRLADVVAGKGSLDAPTLPPASVTRLDAPTLDAVATPQAAPRPGAMIRYFGDYELLEEIARGGMGVVYKARQVKLNRVVAIKMILSGQLASKEDVQRFYTEAEAAAGLDHPGIVPIFEVGEHAGQHFFSMGFVDGESLSSRLSAGPLPPREAAELVSMVAEAIQYAHDRGVIHRDLKPANILLSNAECGAQSAESESKTSSSLHTPQSAFRTRVTDFGLAKRTAADSNLTGTGQILGTPSYMPPEQAAGRLSEVRETADVYSLGAILYATLTGRPPFQADNPLDTLMQVLEREAVPPRTLNPKIPLDIETICLKCLEKDRRRRYSSARALTEELQRFLDGKAILARPISRPARGWRWCRRNPVVASLLMAVMLSLIAGTIVSAMFAIEARLSAAGEVEQRREADRQTGIAKEQLVRAGWLLYASEISAAQREGELNNPTRAIAHLDRTAPEQRSWEYYYLRRQSDRSLRSVIKGHSQQVISLALSPDEHVIASASRDKTVKVWDAAAGRQLQNLNCDNQLVIKLAFSSSDERLAGIATDGKLRVWNVATGNVEQVITTHAISALAACNLVFTANGESVITGNRDGSLRVWDVASGREQSSIPLPVPAPSIALAVSTDGQHLVCGLPVSTAHSAIRIFKLSGSEVSSSEARVVVANVEGVITDVAIDDEGTRIVSSTLSQQNTAQGAIQLWDATTGKELVNASFRARQVALSADGRLLIGIGTDGSMKTWEAQSGVEVSSFQGQAAPSDALTFSRSRGLLVRGNAAGGVEIWETGRADPPLELPLTEWGYSVDFSPDGSQVVSGSSKVLTVWNAISGEQIRAIPGHNGTVHTVAFHPNGRQVLSASWDASIKLWDVATGNEVAQIGGGTREYDSVSFSPSGDRFAMGTSRYRSGIQICSGATAQPADALQGSGGMVTTVAFGPDGVHLTGGDEQGGIVLWNTQQQAAKWTAQDPGGRIRSIAVSRDAKSIATVGRTVSVWDAATGRQRFSVQDPAHAFCVRFTPDGRRLVAGCADATIKFWSVESGQLIFTLNGHKGNINSLAFSPDGQRLASTGNGGAVYVWDSGYYQQ